MKNILCKAKRIFCAATAVVMCGAAMTGSAAVAASAESADTDTSGAFAAYRQLIEGTRSHVEDYVWSDTYGEIKEDAYTFFDMTGDGISEFFCIAAEPGDYAIGADLYVYTYQNGASQLLFETAIDWNAAAGADYCLFRTKKKVYLYMSSGDEIWYNRLYLLEETDGIWGLTEIAAEEIDYTSDGTRSYTVNGEKSDAEAYSEKRSGIFSKAKKIMLHDNIRADESVSALIESLNCTAKTYDKVLAYCDKRINGDSDESAESAETAAGDELLPQIDDTFMFMSGVGGWFTELTLNTDGTFSGKYSDGNLGESGDGYSGTIYNCDFTGSFTGIEKIDDYTYKMTLSGYSIDGNIGDEYITEETRYVISDAYGISGGETFYLYLPGKPMSEIPSTVSDWLSMRGVSGVSELPCKCLYNEAQEDPFFAF